MTRLGIVGYGKIAQKHIEVLRALGCEWIACCDHTPRNRQRAIEVDRFPAVYPTVTEMLSHEQLDGVVVCPTFDRVYEIAIEAIPFGVPLLLEKPPALRFDQHQRLQELAASNRTPVMVGVNRRCYTVLERAIADAGGRHNITAVFVEWSEDPWYLRDTRKLSAGQISAWIYGNSLHGLDLLTFLAGDISEPAVHALNLGEPSRWMMALQGISEKGVLVGFQSTWDSPSRWRLVFCTPHRRYTFAPLETCQVFERGISVPRTIEPDQVDITFKPGFYRQAEAFLEMIGTRRPPETQSLIAVAPAMKLAEVLTDACLAQGQSLNACQIANNGDT